MRRARTSTDRSTSSARTTTCASPRTARRTRRTRARSARPRAAPATTSTSAPTGCSPAAGTTRWPRTSWSGSARPSTTTPLAPRCRSRRGRAGEGGVRDRGDGRTQVGAARLRQGPPPHRADPAQGAHGVAPVEAGARGCTRRRRRPRCARRGRTRHRCVPGSMPTSARARSHPTMPRDDRRRAPRRAGAPVRPRRPRRRRRRPRPTASSASVSGASRCRRSPSSPTRRRSTTNGSVTPTRRAPIPATCGGSTGTTTSPAGRVDVPEHVVLPPSLTGVESPIIVVFGDRFPMITAHKVLAAYACLAPRIVTGQFDPTRHRAIWPSTGQLRPWGHRHQPDHGQPGRGHPAGGDEPGALRLARPLVRGPCRRRHPHAGHGVQRQGDLRRVQRARPSTPTTSCSTSSASSATTSGTTRSPGGRWSTCSTSSTRGRGCAWRRSSRPRDRPGRSLPAIG